jgi:hypothetical protein
MTTTKRTTYSCPVAAAIALEMEAMDARMEARFAAMKAKREAGMAEMKAQVEEAVRVQVEAALAPLWVQLRAIQAEVAPISL